LAHQSLIKRRSIISHRLIYSWPHLSHHWHLLLMNLQRLLLILVINIVLVYWLYLSILMLKISLRHYLAWGKLLHFHLWIVTRLLNVWVIWEFLLESRRWGYRLIHQGLIYLWIVSRVHNRALRHSSIWSYYEWSRIFI
jgi:hypothetical protein